MKPNPSYTAYVKYPLLVDIVSTILGLLPLNRDPFALIFPRMCDAQKKDDYAFHDTVEDSIAGGIWMSSTISPHGWMPR